MRDLQFEIKMLTGIRTLGRRASLGGKIGKPQPQSCRTRLLPRCVDKTAYRSLKFRASASVRCWVQSSMDRTGITAVAGTAQPWEICIRDGRQERGREGRRGSRTQPWTPPAATYRLCKRFSVLHCSVRASSESFLLLSRWPPFTECLLCTRRSTMHALLTNHSCHHAKLRDGRYYPYLTDKEKGISDRLKSPPK